MFGSILIMLHNCEAEARQTGTCGHRYDLNETHRFKVPSRNVPELPSTLMIAWISATLTWICIVINVSQAGFLSRMKTPYNETRTYRGKRKKTYLDFRSIIFIIKANGYPIGMSHDMNWKTLHKKVRKVWNRIEKQYKQHVNIFSSSWITNF